MGDDGAYIYWRSDSRSDGVEVGPGINLWDEDWKDGVFGRGSSDGNDGDVSAGMSLHDLVKQIPEPWFYVIEHIVEKSGSIKKKLVCKVQSREAVVALLNLYTRRVMEEAACEALEEHNFSCVKYYTSEPSNTIGIYEPLFAQDETQQAAPMSFEDAVKEDA